MIGKLRTEVTYNDWKCGDAILTLVDDDKKVVEGRDLFDKNGLEIVQQQVRKSKSVNNILHDSASTIKQAIASQFSELVSSIGISKTLC